MLLRRFGHACTTLAAYRSAAEIAISFYVYLLASWRQTILLRQLLRERACGSARLLRSESAPRPAPSPAACLAGRRRVEGPATPRLNSETHAQTLLWRVPAQIVVHTLDVGSTHAY